MYVVIGIYLIVLLVIVCLMSRMTKKRHKNDCMCIENCNHVDCFKCIDQEQCKLK